MTMNLKGNLVVGQSGGPTGVINQSLVGVIEEAIGQEYIEHVYGAIHGVEGIVNETFCELKKFSAEQLEIVANTPSSSLGSSRVKPDKELCGKIFEVFQKNNVRYFFYIGGNDSASSAHIINEMAKEANYELKTFHVPKTIDNDLLVTDHCPGYGTAATFVSRAILGDDMDNRALPGVKIDIIMGRHAGFLTASAMLARRPDDDTYGPHLIYVPERPVSMEQFVNDVLTTYSNKGRCLVACSEGICDENHVPWAQRIQENAEVDSHGNVQLSGSGALADFLITQLKKAQAKGRYRADTFGYLQRSFPGLISPTDAREARLCGRMAVKYACEEDYESGSVSMKRLGNGDQYAIETFVTDLSNVAVKTKSLPDEYINDAGNNITDAFRDYVTPLVAPVPATLYLR